MWLTRPTFAIPQRRQAAILSWAAIGTTGYLVVVAAVDRDWWEVLAFGCSLLLAVVALLAALRDSNLPPPKLLEGFEDGADSD